MMLPASIMLVNKVLAHCLVCVINLGKFEATLFVTYLLFLVIKLHIVFYINFLRQTPDRPDDLT